VISWRYHVVTIAGILLALGLGILAGTSVIGDRFADSLNRRYDEMVEQRNGERERANQLAALLNEAVPLLTAGKLDAVPVVLVTMEGLDGELVDTARRSLENAGAEVRATLILGRGLSAGQSDEQDAALAEALELSPSTPEELAADAAAAVADRLSGAIVPDEADADGDLLRRLRDAQFLGTDASNGDLADVGGDGQAIMVVTDGDGANESSPDRFLLPFLRGLVQAGSAVAVGEGRDSGYGLVTAIHDDGAIPQERAVTVDDLDVAAGEIALVLGLDRLIEVPDGGGRYGIGGDSLLPTPTPTPSATATPTPSA
jgi:Copper transport outer membrane protein, MctB